MATFNTLDEFLSSWREPLVLKYWDFVVIHNTLHTVTTRYLNNVSLRYPREWNNFIFDLLNIKDPHQFASSIYWYDSLWWQFPECRKWDYAALTRIYIALSEYVVKESNIIVIDFLWKHCKELARGTIDYKTIYIEWNNMRKKKDFLVLVMRKQLPFFSKLYPCTSSVWRWMITERFLIFNEEYLYASRQDDVDMVKQEDATKYFSYPTKVITFNIDEIEANPKEVFTKIYEALWATKEQMNELTIFD